MYLVLDSTFVIDHLKGVYTDFLRCFFETEELEVRWVPFEEALAMTLDGRITDALSVCGIERLALLRSRDVGR